MRLGVLDQSPVRSGGSPADSIHETLDLARAADRLGYHRYWLAEHHLKLYTGRAGRYPSVEEAEAYSYTSHELAIARHARRRTIAGAPEQVRERLSALAAEYGVDELVVVTITHDPKARFRSYELLA